jgi:hypothetical protein
MAARAAIALSLAALAWVGGARAGDDPSCAQYHDALSYNLCLASHWPKANNIGKLRGARQPGRGAHDRAWVGQTRASGARFHRWSGAQRVHGRMRMEFPVR